MEICACGKTFEKKSSLIPHLGHCKLINPNGKKGGNGGGWNRGLTKENSESIRKQADTYVKNYRSREPRSLSQDIRDKISKSVIKFAQEHPGRLGGSTNGGRGIKGKYLGIKCDSSWELAYVIYNLEHNIPFERNHERFLYYYLGKPTKYTPDFIENGVYIEIKGYDRNAHLLEEKIKQFPHPIKILRKEEMRKYLDYTIEKYGKKFVTLYDHTVIDCLNNPKIQSSLNADRINLILGSSIDFQSFGWVCAVSQLLNLTHTSVKRFMEKEMTEFYYNCKHRRPRNSVDRVAIF